MRGGAGCGSPERFFMFCVNSCIYIYTKTEFSSDFCMCVVCVGDPWAQHILH